MPEIRSENGRFFMEDQGQTVAEITFSSLGDNVISIDHTFVSPQLRGKGIAEQLIRKVIEYAREENLKINPTCSYAGYHFDKFPEDRDLLN
ncbi:GNAT family N-acetyltransferase [Paenibacillus dakarensis]|uniref:GNAT family N-acetyltransferase n=1 Tax=Paenibacillus dakarensis TaxID=1527293 RepID=UPI0006D53818|nr:GNAT family N-acetyltransferase [Paenibacillus dakarensis]